MNPQPSTGAPRQTIDELRTLVQEAHSEASAVAARLKQLHGELVQMTHGAQPPERTMLDVEDVPEPTVEVAPRLEPKESSPAASSRAVQTALEDLGRRQHDALSRLGPRIQRRAESDWAPVPARPPGSAADERASEAARMIVERAQRVQRQTPDVACKPAPSAGRAEPHEQSTQALGSQPDETAVATSRPWLPRGLRQLAVEDPAAAGRLLLALAPAHGLVESGKLSYDLSLEEVGCLAVTVDDGVAVVDERDRPRTPDAVDIQITTTLAGLGQLLTAPLPRRLVSGGHWQITGNRRKLSSLRALAQAPLGLATLHAAGVRPDPALIYRVLAKSIEPQWTVDERFALVHEAEGTQQRCCVRVESDLAVAVTSEPPTDLPVVVIVSCPPERFLPLLSGDLSPARERELVSGDFSAFMKLQDWVARVEWAGAYSG